MDQPSQKPQDHEASGHKVLWKTAELAQVTGAHAFAIFADAQHTCHFHASSGLQSLGFDFSAATFFCKQLVNNLHAGQNVIPRFAAGPLQPPYQAKDKERYKAWSGCAGTLQDLLKAMIHDHPNNAFLVYLEYSMGKDLDTFQAALPQLQSVFQQPGWHQHVLQRVKAAGMPVANSDTA